MEKTFGDRLLSARTNAGINQAELASMVGLTKAAISSMESGKTKFPTPPNLFDLADALKVSPRWLATGKGDMSNKEDSLPVDVSTERLLRLLQRLPESKRYEVIDLVEHIEKIEQKKVNILLK